MVIKNDLDLFNIVTELRGLIFNENRFVLITRSKDVVAYSSIL